MGQVCCAEPKPDIQAKRSMDEEFFKLHVDAGHMNDRRRSFVDRLYTILGDETTLDAATCVEIKILRRVRSMAWRCRFLIARRGQHGRVMTEKCTRHTG